MDDKPQSQPQAYPPTIVLYPDGQGNQEFRALCAFLIGFFVVYYFFRLRDG